MSRTLRRATGPTLAGLFVMIAGCQPDANGNAVDPLATDLMPTHSVESVVIEGIEYEYGCPDYPCPVTDLVKSHVDGGKWFWIPMTGTGRPAIYLYVLRVPIGVREKVKEEEDPPPPFLKLDPYLEGPAEMMGTHLPPGGQLACLKVGLDIISPDGRSWDFVSGEQILTFEEGPPQQRYLFEGEWGYLDGHLYGVYPGVKTGYDALFRITVRGVDGETHVLEHAMRCEDPEPPPPPAPVRPRLTGPDVVRGERLPDKGLVCRDFELEVVSPDEGPWSFVSGRMLLSYLRWGWDRGEWIRLDRKRTIVPLGQDKWDQLLNGNFMTVPEVYSTAYYAAFEAVVRRVVGETVYDYEIEHRLVCVGPDLYDQLYGQER